MKHTPAPWLYDIEDCRAAIVDAEGFHIVDLHTTWNSTAHSSLEANVRLIAAAPELADALDELLRVTVDAALNAGFCLNDEQQAARDRALALFERFAGDEK